MKRLTALLVPLVLCLWFAPAILADDPVSYLDENDLSRVCSDYTVLTADTTDWADGWYVADTVVNLNSKVTVTGSVYLILEDNATLVALDIDVPAGSSLTVYTQSRSADQGVLTLAGSLHNNGTLTGSGTLSLQDSSLQNQGTMILDNCTLSLQDSSLQNQGTMTLDNSTLSLDRNSRMVIEEDAALYVNGTAEAPCTINIAGTLEVLGSLELDDTVLTNTGIINGTGVCILSRTSQVNGLNDDDLAIEYRIFLNANGGSLSGEDMVVTVGKKLPFIPEPTMESAVFDGWFTHPDRGEQVTADTLLDASQTLYAHWRLPSTPKPDATPTPTPDITPTPTPTVTPTATPVLTPTTAPTSKPTANPTAPPKPTPLEMHTLHFNTMGGLPLEDVKFGLGAPVELWPYTPTRAGYLFMGWYTDEALTQPVGTIVLVKDTTLYAKWVVDPVAAAAAAGSSGSGGSGSGSGGGSKATPTPEPTKAPTPEPTVTPEPTEVPETSEEDSDGGLPILPIVGGVVLLAVAAGGIVVLRRRSLR